MLIIPYNVDVPMKRLPYANWVLIGVTSILSIWVMISRDPAASTLALHRDSGEIYQLFTSIFVHADPIHLIGNMIFLFCFGNAINAKLGHVPFVLFYQLLGGIGGLAWLLLGSAQVALGASGAVMGITGMFLVIYPRNDVCIYYCWGYRVGGLTEISSCWLILLFMIGDFVGCLFYGDSGGVGYICHLSAELAGIAIACLLIVTGLVKLSALEENLFQALGLQPQATPDGKRPPRRRRRKQPVTAPVEPEPEKPIPLYEGELPRLHEQILVLPERTPIQHADPEKSSI